MIEKYIEKNGPSNNLFLTKISFLFMTFFLTMFGSGEFKIPIIPMSMPTKYTLLTIGLLFSVFLVKSNKIFLFKLDSISILLFIHLILYTLILLMNYSSDFILTYFTYLFAFLGYLWASNSRIDVKTYKYFLYSFLIVIIFQTALTVYFVGRTSIALYLFKSSIIIPIGASNGITTFVVMIFPILYKLGNSRFTQYTLTIFVFVFAILSRSNSGLISILSIIILLFFREKNYKVLRILFISLGLLVFLFLIGKYYPGYLNRFTITIQTLFSNSDNNQNIALNGRSNVFKNVVDLIKNHFILGNGFHYRDKMPSKLMAHNWIFEYLVTGGIFSLVIKLSVFCSFLFSILKIKNRNLKEGMIIGFVFSLIQGLVEPSFGSPTFELIFAMVFGFGLNVYSKIDTFELNQLKTK